MFCVVLTFDHNFPQCPMPPIFNDKGELLSSGQRIKNCVRYFTSLKPARKYAKEMRGDLLTRARWSIEDMMDHAERMKSQGKQVFGAWWVTTKFVWGKSANPVKMAYKLSQSQGRKAMKERDEAAGVDEMGEIAVYNHQFGFSV